MTELFMQSDISKLLISIGIILGLIVAIRIFIHSGETKKKDNDKFWGLKS